MAEFRVGSIIYPSTIVFLSYFLAWTYSSNALIMAEDFLTLNVSKLYFLAAMLFTNCG